MRALRDFNTPKIVMDDKPIFLRLIEDLFPKLNPPVKIDAVFGGEVRTTTKKNMGLYTEDSFITKVEKLKEILEVRHCVFVIGPTGAGKSAVWKTMVRTFRDTDQETEFDPLNPKAITSDELFGAYTK